MKITRNKVAAIEYTLKNTKGDVLDTSEGMGPLEYLHGHDNLIAGLEKELEGKEAGAVFSVTLAPADGYGEISDELILDVPLSNFGEIDPIEIGMQFETDTGDGNRVVTVRKVGSDSVTVDANHELAGETLIFDVKVSAVRDATQVEIANGLGGNCGCDGGAGGGCGGCGGGCH